MTSRTKSEQIVREAVIQAVPEILELKFGCEIKQKYSTKETAIVLGTASFIRDDKVEYKYVNTTHGATLERVYVERYFPSDNYITEILGRPIRLADILEAARKIGYNSTEDWLSMINGIVLHWNLRADSLSEQSDETIHFLAELFSKGE